jgi:hypothetical protein
VTDRLLEIRTYRLLPETTKAFHQVFLEQARPLLTEFGVDVVRGAPSERNEAGEESYVLLRAFDSLEQREEQEQRFYGSRQWRDGPREPVLSKIESYHTVVLTLPAEIIDGMRS